MLPIINKSIAQRNSEGLDKVPEANDESNADLNGDDSPEDLTALTFEQYMRLRKTGGLSNASKEKGPSVKSKRS